MRVDGVITDYSSIYIDGLILDLPLAFVAFDRPKYFCNRGIAYDYNLITPAPKISTLNQFKNACLEMKSGADQWRDPRESVRKIFFKCR